MQLQHVQKSEHILDVGHAASWETCFIIGTCNFTQELSCDGGSSSILASDV
jgi:hypothetical protein